MSVHGGVWIKPAGTAAVVISGGQGNCVAGHVSFSRIAGGRGVVDAQSTANKGFFFASKGGVDCNNPYFGWDVRGKALGTTTGDFVASTTGSAVQLNLINTAGNTPGFVQVGNAGDTTTGEFQLNPYGGALMIGAGARASYANNADAVAALGVGRCVDRRLCPSAPS